MTKKELLSDPNSCLNRARDDEPLFVLRANDELAPVLIMEWVSRYLELKGAGITDTQHRKAREANYLLVAMHKWRLKNASQEPRDPASLAP